MESVIKFLDALETQGGQIMVLCFILVFISVCAMIAHAYLGPLAKTLLSNAFTAVSTLLLTKLNTPKKP